MGDMGRRVLGILVVVASVAALLLGIDRARRAADPSRSPASPARVRPGQTAPEAPAVSGARFLRRIPGAPARRIAGRVIADRLPVRGAVVRLGVPAETVELPDSEAATGADGGFDFGVRPAAWYMVTALTDDSAPAVVASASAATRESAVGNDVADATVPTPSGPRRKPR
jgi:hypothetical protein